MAIANGTVSYMPPSILQKFERDLSVISSYFAKENDFVVVKDPIDESWVSYMKGLGFKLPNYILRDKISENRELKNTELGFIRPWGWSPVVHNIFKNIRPLCSVNFQNTPNSIWCESHKDLYSRITALNIYNYITSNYDYDFLAGEDDVPKVCNSVKEVENLLERFDKLVVKAPWSSSGRGLLIIKDKSLSIQESQWISGILKNQSYIMAEEWREKLFDLSFHYFIDEKSRVKHIGNVSFFTDDKGSYQGNNLRALPSSLDESIYGFLRDGNMDVLSDILKDALEKSSLPENYYGYLGVDAYVYNTDDGLKIFPCVEINLRYTMGTLNLKMREFVTEDSEGYLVTRRVNHCSMPEFVKHMQVEYPIELKSGKLRKGFISLVPVNEETVFINYLLLI